MNDCPISLKVNRLRVLRGLTTTQLAERVGISQAQISRLENGKQGFRSATLSKIADALDVKIVYFFQDCKNASKVTPKLEKALRDEQFAVFMGHVADLYIERTEALIVFRKALESFHQ